MLVSDGCWLTYKNFESLSCEIETGSLLREAIVSSGPCTKTKIRLLQRSKVLIINFDASLDLAFISPLFITSPLLLFSLLFTSFLFYFFLLSVLLNISKLS